MNHFPEQRTSPKDVLKELGGSLLKICFIGIDEKTPEIVKNFEMGNRVTSKCKTWKILVQVFRKISKLSKIRIEEFENIERKFISDSNIRISKMDFANWGMIVIHK